MVDMGLLCWSRLGGGLEGSKFIVSIVCVNNIRWASLPLFFSVVFSVVSTHVRYNFYSQQRESSKSTPKLGRW